MRYRRVSSEHLGQGTEQPGEVHGLGLHDSEQVFGQPTVPVFGTAQAEFRPHVGKPEGLVHGHEAFDLFCSHPDRIFGVVRVDERQQGLGEAREIPLGDRGLVAVGITPMLVDRTEHRPGVVRVDKRAGPVVQSLTGDGHVVGVHHPVDEPHGQPLRDEDSLSLAHCT